MNKQINSFLLWTTPKVVKQEATWMFSFNGWNLDNGRNIRVVSSNHDDIWTIDLDSYKAPLQDGGGVLWKYYRTKTIQIWLSISADTSESLNNLIDEIKYQTSVTEWQLKIVINWIVRERKATCTSLKFNRGWFNVDRVWNVVLTFACVNPHSHLKEPTTVNLVSQQWNYQSGVVYEWRANTFPKLFLSMDSWTSNGMSAMLNWYTLQITEELHQGDIIIFDGETKTVTLNDEEIKYSWPFTPLVYWENFFSITNSGTYTGTLSFYTRYL